MRCASRVVLLFVLSLTGCASTQSPARLDVPTAEEAWKKLRSVSASAQVFESYSKLSFSLPARQSVNARTAVDREGRFFAELLTPLGTTAATMFADRDGVVFVNHLEQSYWRGSHQELAAVSPAVASLLRIGLESGLLLYGVPSADSAVTRCGDSCFEAAGFRHEVAPEGLVSVSGSGVSFEYAPPAYPAQRAAVTIGSQAIVVENLDVQTRAGSVRRLSPPSGYRCCVAPSLELQSGS